MIRLARAFSTIKFVEKCPLPAYDTGCTYCRLPTFPPDKQIDYDKNLHGTAASMWKHILTFLHGVTDFHELPSKIDLVPGSLANNFESIKRKMLSPLHPVTLSDALVSDLNIPFGDQQMVYIYPDHKKVTFSMAHLPQFIEHYLLPENEVAEVYNPFSFVPQKSYSQKSHPGLFEESEIESDLILICGHAQRDIRCGKLAPLLKDEFERVLEKENLSNSVKVGLISHIGGHAYAGNVIYFSRNSNPIWYGRVVPERVQGIVQETVIGKKIIRELYRGAEA